MARKLTDRESAVLAAIDRRTGAATLLDLRDDFPNLAPSAVARVIDALEARGLAIRRGDPAQLYLGGVTFVSTSFTLEQRNARLLEFMGALDQGGWRPRWCTDGAPAAVVEIPLDEVRELIHGKESRLAELRHFVAEHEDVGWSQIGVTIKPATTSAGACLQVAFVNNEPSDAEWAEIDAADQLAGGDEVGDLGEIDWT